MTKHASSASYSLSGISHPPQRSGCVFGVVFALLSWSSLWIFFSLCWLSCLCTSLASDSSNGGFAPSCLYMSWSLSSHKLSIEQTVVPSGLCSVVCVCCVGCCASSYW